MSIIFSYNSKLVLSDIKDNVNGFKIDFTKGLIANSVFMDLEEKYFESSFFRGITLQCLNRKFCCKIEVKVVPPAFSICTKAIIVLLRGFFIEILIQSFELRAQKVFYFREFIRLIYLKGCIQLEAIEKKIFHPNNNTKASFEVGFYNNNDFTATNAIINISHCKNELGYSVDKLPIMKSIRQDVGPKESRGYGILIEENGLDAGTYICTVNVVDAYSPENIYESKQFFLEVMPS